MRGCPIVQDLGMMGTLIVLMDTIEEFHCPFRVLSLDPYQQRKARNGAV